jgi:hypothetical protein
MRMLGARPGDIMSEIRTWSLHWNLNVHHEVHNICDTRTRSAAWNEGMSVMKGKFYASRIRNKHEQT